MFADYGGLGQGSFAYDGFGNRTSWTPPGSAPIPEPVSTVTNRLTLSGVQYDTAGNLLTSGNSPNDPDFGWDGLGMMTSVFTGGLELRQFAYTADNERILVLEPDGLGGTRQVWRLRDLDGNVLREYKGGGACTATQHLTISIQTLTGVQLREACQTITAGPSVTVASGASVLFEFAGD